MPRSTWSKEQLFSLYKMRTEDKKSFSEIAQALKKSSQATQRKFLRVDWEDFKKNPVDYLKEDNSEQKKWDQLEMSQLYAFLQSGKSYSFVAEQLGRTYTAIERKAQTTNWQAWKIAIGNSESNPSVSDVSTLTTQLVEAFVLLSRRDPERLKTITEKEFRRKINFETDPLPVSFNELKNKAKQELDSIGLGNPEEISLGEGTYLIVGDSHGKWTKNKMFDLLTQVNKTLKPDKIIHVGHILDDDNDISYNWGQFKNLIVVAKQEELHIVQEQRNKYDFMFDIVRGGVNLGDDLFVMNQDMIQDYVRTSLKSLDAVVFDPKVIVNCHRLESITKCSEENTSSYILSPGCICEPHIVKTIKQIDYLDKKTVKQAFYGGFSKYRRMQHLYNYWNQGLLVIHVDSEGNHTIIPCLIRKMSDGFATSYFDKIISNTGVHKPTKKIFVTADAHCPDHDTSALDVQEQICKDYKPDALVNLGDVDDYASLNHHEMDRGVVILKDIISEAATTHYVMKRMAKWAKELHVIHGNHERFALDFISKFPQFASCLNFKFLCGIEELGYKMTDLKDVLKIGSTKFIHGDIKMYGQPGDKMEKASRTFGENIFIGHVHYPAIRFGSYSIGLSGKLDQEYNEPNASTWIHGFGMCNQYKGLSWPTTIAIYNYACIINGKIYNPVNPDSWKVKKFKAKLAFDIE